MLPKLKFPKTSDFSEPALEKCFSRKILKGLYELDETRQKIRSEITTVYQMFAEVIPGKKEDALLDFFPRKYISIMDSKMSSRYYEYFMKKVIGIRKICEICGHRAVHRHHILEKSFIRKVRKGANYYAHYRDHFANIMLLCANHHDIIHRKHGLRLRKIDIKFLISRRKRINRKVEKEIESEMKSHEKCFELLNVFRKKHEKRIMKDFKTLLKKLKKVCG
jgi:predicted restriction endonuclease